MIGHLLCDPLFHQNQSIYNHYYQFKRSQTLMAEQENYLTLQSIRMLELFPVRKIQCLDFDLEKYKKLYDVLACSFCREIFNNPTYLRCSHRFCKDCIQKHIRKNDKKSCPICRGELTTKRDTKSDLKLISLISFAFGDPAALQNEIDKYEEEATKNMKFIKTKRGIQMELKRDRPQSLDNKLKNLQNIPRKRATKDAEQDEAEFKMVEQKKKQLIEEETLPKFTRSEEMPKQKPQVHPFKIQNDWPLQQISQKQPEKRQIKVNWGNTKTKQKANNKKKKTEIIQIFSEGSNQIQISKSKKYTDEFQLSVNSSRIPQHKKVLEEKPENKLIIDSPENKKGSQINIQQVVEVSAPNIENSIHGHLQFEVVVQKTQQKFLTDNKFDSDVIANRMKLKQKLNSQYMKTLLLKCNRVCSINISLVPEPKSMTPALPKRLFQMSIHIKISQIRSFVLSKLNLSGKIPQSERVLQLSLNNQQNDRQFLTDNSQTLLDLLQTSWKNFKGVNFFNLNNSLRDRPVADKNIRTIFYRIRYNQLQERRRPTIN